jgi:hypothetical protein
LSLALSLRVASADVSSKSGWRAPRIERYCELRSVWEWKMRDPIANAPLLCTSASGSESDLRKRGKREEVKGVTADSIPLTISARAPMAVDRSPVDRSRSCSIAHVSRDTYEEEEWTHVVLSHIGEEGVEELSKVGSKDAGKGTNEVARRADERSVVLGLLARGHDLTIGVVVDLAGRRSLEDRIEVVANGLDV